MLNRVINTHVVENQLNFRSGIETIIEDKELFDVTLVCDDGHIEAHKVLLSIASDFFRSVLKKSNHPHPLLYIRGLKKVLLQSIVNFLYYGEVNISEDDLPEFLSTSQELKIRGIDERIGISDDYSESENYCRESLDDFEVNADNYREHVKEDDNLGTIQFINDSDCFKHEEQIEDPLPAEHDHVLENDDIKEDDETMFTHSSARIKGYKRDDAINRSIQDIERIRSSKSPTDPKFAPFIVGNTFDSMDDVKIAIKEYSEANFSPLVSVASSASKGRTLSGMRRRVTYGCPYGQTRKSASKGIRQRTSRYVGCPVYLRIHQLDDNRFVVVKSELEHKEHEISEEAFKKTRKKITIDQEDAIKAFLVNEPSFKEVSEFLKELTGREFDNGRTKNIINRLRPVA